MDSKKLNKAAALAYKENIDNAPKIVASGTNAVALEIVKKAEEFDIPLFSNPLLVDTLLKCDVGEEIPSELYRAVIDVFIWLQKSESSTQISD